MTEKTQKGLIDLVLENQQYDRVGRNALKKASEYIKVKKGMDVDRTGLLELLRRAIRSKEREVAVRGILGYAQIWGHHTKAANKAIEVMEGWSKWPELYAIANCIKAESMFERYFHAIRFREDADPAWLLHAKFYFLKAVLNAPDKSVHYNNYCRAIAAARSKVPTNNEELFLAEYNKISRVVAEKAMRLFNEKLFKQFFDRKTEFFEAIQQIDDELTELCDLAYDADQEGILYQLGVKPEPCCGKLNFHELTMLNLFSEGFLSYEIGEPAYFLHEGTKEELESAVRRTEKFVQDFFQDRDAISKYKFYYEYNVSLSFSDDPGSLSHGTGFSYEQAYQQAEQGFPYELSSAANIKNTVEMVFHFDNKAIELMRKNAIK